MLHTAWATGWLSTLRASSGHQGVISVLYRAYGSDSVLQCAVLSLLRGGDVPSRDKFGVLWFTGPRFCSCGLVCGLLLTTLPLSGRRGGDDDGGVREDGRGASSRANSDDPTGSAPIRARPRRAAQGREPRARPHRGLRRRQGPPRPGQAALGTAVQLLGWLVADRAGFDQGLRRRSARSGVRLRASDLVFPARRGQPAAAAEEYPPGITLVPMKSRTLSPFRTTNLVVVQATSGACGSKRSDFVACGDALLIDPGCCSQVHAELADLVNSLPKKLVVLVTHHHHDHIDGHSVVQRCNPDAVLLTHQNTMKRIGKGNWSNGYTAVTGGEYICIGDQELQAHTDGHMGVRHVNTNALIVGDHCVGRQDFVSYLYSSSLKMDGRGNARLHVLVANKGRQRA